MMEREGIVICMLNTHHGALNTPKITTTQISIVASVVNRIMVKLAYKLSIIKEVMPIIFKVMPQK